MTEKQEQQQVKDNISLAFVNGHITAGEAAAAHDSAGTRGGVRQAARRNRGDVRSREA